jgi:hypothetical protein
MNLQVTQASTIQLLMKFGLQWSHFTMKCMDTLMFPSNFTDMLQFHKT